MLPETIQIGSVTWKVKVCEKLPDKSEDWGLCDPDISTIWIAKGPRDVMKDTFIHEVLHAMVFTFGLMRKFKGDGEEDVIAALTPSLLSTFKIGIKK